MSSHADAARFRTDKRHVLGALALFATFFALAAVIGAVGPKVIVEHDGGSHSGHDFNVYSVADTTQLDEDSQFITEDTIWSGRINDMVAEHQMIWLECRVKRPDAYKDAKRHSFQLTFKVDAYGYGRTRGFQGEASDNGDKHLVTDRWYVHEIHCPAEKAWCNPVSLFAQHVVVHESYQVQASIVAPRATFPATIYAPVLRTQLRLKFVNREFTSYAMGWYYTTWVISLVVLAAPRVGFYARLPKKSGPWSFEQRWTLALLLGLLTLFDYPLFACEVFAASKVASLTLTTLYIYGAFAFVGALLCFFLFVVRDCREPCRDLRRHIITATALGQALLCSGIAHLATVLNLYFRLEGAGEPDAADAGGQHVFKTVRVALIVLVGTYVAWFLVECGRTLRVFSSCVLPAHELLLLFLSVAVLVTTLAAIFLGGYDSLSSDSLSFTLFFAAPNLYVWTLAYIYSPLALLEEQAQSLELTGTAPVETRRLEHDEDDDDEELPKDLSHML